MGKDIIHKCECDKYGKCLIHIINNKTYCSNCGGAWDENKYLDELENKKVKKIFHKKVRGEYTNQNNENMLLWEFWQDDNKHIFNLFLIGDEPNLKSGGFFSLYALQCAKNNNIKVKDEMKGGLK